MIVGRCTIPEAAITIRAVRSSGPGGQNVNKVASKVEVRVDLDALVGLDAAARARLLALARNQLDANGHLLVTSQLTRDQRRNLEDARDKIRELVARALTVPTVRRKTKPTRGSVERRIQDKKRRARTKSSRRGDD